MELHERKIAKEDQEELAKVVAAPQRPRKGKHKEKEKGNHAKAKKPKPTHNTIVLLDRKGRYAKIKWECDAKGRIKPLPEAIFQSSRMVYLVEPQIHLKGKAHGVPEHIEEMQEAELIWTEAKVSDIMRDAFEKAGGKDLVASRPMQCTGAKAEHFHCSVA